MLNQLNSNVIAILCYYIDSICRKELYLKNITSERDYVSNLATHLRFPLGPFFPFKFAHARTLQQGLEQKFGCDSIVIFRKNGEAKVGLFEAKWPRYFFVPSYKWDSLKSNGNSRFSSQIIRQRNWSRSGAVIWEMFFNESKPGVVNTPFDQFGSSCLLHKDANYYFTTYKKSSSILWNNNDLVSILPLAMSFKRIVFNILRCNYGKIFTVEKNSINIKSKVKDEEYKIPIYSKETGPFGMEDSTIRDFMEETGIDNYIIIDLSEIDDGLLFNI